MHKLSSRPWRWRGHERPRGMGGSRLSKWWFINHMVPRPTKGHGKLSPLCCFVMSFRTAKAISGPPSGNCHQSPRLLERSAGSATVGNQEVCRYSMWWCIYVRPACATGVEADTSSFPLRETPSLWIANNEQPKESLRRRKNNIWQHRSWLV